MKKKLPNKAFTLIELLIVMAILGSLATFVVINFTGAQASARDTKRKAEIREYQNALEIFANKNNFKYPDVTNGVAKTQLCGSGAQQIDGLSCTSDPKVSQGWTDYQYINISAGLNYILYAELERRDSATVPEFFVVCSTGEAGIKKTSAPTALSDCASL